MAAYEADVESDMSAIHRIDDIYALPAERVFRLARRLAHYPGCVRSALADSRRAQEGPGRPGDGVDWVAPDRESIRRSALGDVLSC